MALLVAQYTALVSLVAPASVPRVVANDADDDHVIAAGVAARAELIVTGDRKHLLPIGSHQGIAIVTAREVVDRIEATGKT
jgi:predicted nucleic acid-binding protein